MRRKSALRAPYGRGLIVLSAMAAISAAWLVGVPAASGAAVTTSTPWVQMSTPHQSGSNPDDVLSSVSCPTVKFCMAVGTAVPNRFASQSNHCPVGRGMDGKLEGHAGPESRSDEQLRIAERLLFVALVLHRTWVSLQYRKRGHLFRVVERLDVDPHGSTHFEFLWALKRVVLRHELRGRGWFLHDERQ